MDGKKLETIANGFYAASKIQNIYNNNIKSNSETRSAADKNSALREILEIIAQYSPNSYRNSISEAMSKSAAFSDTYRNLKNHLNRYKNGSNMNRNSTEATNMPTAEGVIRALDIIKPAAGEQSSYLIDKIIKIYDILKS